MQHWHQRIGIGGMLAEEHDIKFALSSQMAIAAAP
jgi:hypothetical protein